MLLSQLNYTLPKELIANEPVNPRDTARLLVLDKNTGEILHKHFYDLPNILTSNDVLVFNETKVFPARLFAGKTEILLLKELSNSSWTAMHRGKVTIGEMLDFGEIKAKVTSKEGYEITLQFENSREDILLFIDQKGKTPLPPYINNNNNEKQLRKDYQTVYAKYMGSVAAPTAGLHFTKELIQSIKEKGIQIEYVTLHVGAGTFLPIKEEDITKHHMHSEYFNVDPKTAVNLNAAKASGKRIIAVGTTTTRVLEARSKNNEVSSGGGKTDIYIYPPYKFKFVDSLVTNFHLPHSTLLALVSAFVSAPQTKNIFVNFEESIVGKAYKDAIENNYKFYSFGDGMIIL